MIGGISGHDLGQAIPQKDLEELGKQLHPNTSAYLALVEDKDSDRFAGEVQA